MANTKVYGEQIVDGSITAAKLADGTIVAAELADNAVVTAAINADAVTNAKIADNAIDSEHYTDGSIDTAHIAASQITLAKMAVNSIDSDQYVDGSIDTAHIAASQVTTAKIADGNISTAKLADLSVTSGKLATNLDLAGTLDVTGATVLDSTLGVTGTATFTGLVDAAIIDGVNFKVNGGQGSDGQVLTSTGSGVAWETASSFNADAAQVFNESGADVDFRIESDGNSNMFWVNGGTNAIAIGSDNLLTTLHVDAADSEITMNVSSGLSTTSAWNGIGFGARNSMKSAILHQRTTSYSRGSLLFCVNSDADNSHADINDVALTIDNAKLATFAGAATIAGVTTIANTSAANVNNESHILIRNLANGNIVTDGLTYNCAEDKLGVGTNLFLAGGYIRSGAANLGFGTASMGQIVTLDNSTGDFLVDSTTAVGSFYNGLNDTGFGAARGGYTACVRSGTNTPLYVSTAGTGSGGFISFSQNGATRGDITYTGSAVAYNTSSDYRLKENVVTDWNATTRLKQLKPSQFNFIETPDTTVEGFLAHEVSSIVPQAVTGEKDELYTAENSPEEMEDLIGEPKYQVIDQSKLVPLLVKTIQELEARITTLEG